MKFKIKRFREIHHPSTPKQSTSPPRGLGDIVARVAEPIKGVLMKHGPASVRRWLQNCKCPEWRKWLNEKVPL